MSLQVVPSSLNHTERLYVMYDTAETVAFLRLMADNLRQGKEFRFIALGSSVNSLTLANCSHDPERYRQIMERQIRLQLPDVIDPRSWDRERKMSKESIRIIQESVDPAVVITGVASRVQKQVLSHFKKAVKISYLDNFEYHETQCVPTCSVTKVQQASDIVLYPSSYTASLFLRADGSQRRFEIVGSPTLESWKLQIQSTTEEAKQQILDKLGFHRGEPIVAFMDAYDNGTDDTYRRIMSPLFEELATLLPKHGYQALVQPHPKMKPQKVTTQELLAVCDYVVGYNSSTVFSGLTLGKRALYLMPQDRPYDHFSIKKGYAQSLQFSTCEEVPQKLLELLEKSKLAPIPDLSLQEHIPSNSICKINETVDRALREWQLQQQSSTSRESTTL